MRLFKFSCLFLFIVSLESSYAFTGNECLNTNFDVKVSHQGKPFGLSKVKVDISKVDCTITVSHEKFKYIKNSWSIDVCREPIHIKKNGGSEVLKKKNDCGNKSSDGFCQSMDKLLTVIQDDALIFAEGEKEKVNSNHGKSYCAYLLLKKYLGSSKVFNRGQDYSKLFENGYSSNSTIEVKQNPTRVAIPRPVVEGIEKSDSSKSDEVATPVVKPQEETKGVGTF